MPSRGCLGCLSVCCCLTLVVGGALLALGLMGYFSFKDPCIKVKSFTITDLDISRSSNNVFGAITGLPSQATMTIEILLEVNNTNTYNVKYRQDPNQNNITINDELDIGEWELPPGKLAKKSSNELPLTLTTTIDFLSGDAVGVAASMMAGKTVRFRVAGSLLGKGWIPVLEGRSTLDCTASLSSLLEGELAQVVCYHESTIGNIMQSEKEIGTSDIQDAINEEDTSCYV